MFRSHVCVMEKNFFLQGDPRHQCPLCPSTFTQSCHLKRHQRTAHGKTSFSCEQCGVTFKRKDELQRHLKRHTKKKQHQCPDCSRKFHRRDNLASHVRICTRRERGESQRASDSLPNQSQIGGAQTAPNESEETDEHSSLNNNLKVIKMHPRATERSDLSLFLVGKKNSVLKNLERELQKRRGQKWYISVQVRLIKHKPDSEDETAMPHFRSLTLKTTNSNELRVQLKEAIEKVKSSFVEFQREGSGWQLDEVLHLDLNIATYAPLIGSSYIHCLRSCRTPKPSLTSRTMTTNVSYGPSWQHFIQQRQIPIECRTINSMNMN